MTAPDVDASGLWVEPARSVAPTDLVDLAQIRDWTGLGQSVLKKWFYMRRKFPAVEVANLKRPVFLWSRVRPILVDLVSTDDPPAHFPVTRWPPA
jgi:hypothetical protein